MAHQTDIDRYRALLSAIPGVAFIIDSAGTYLEVMGSDRSGFYRDAGQLRDTSVWDVFPHEQAEAFMKVVNEAIETNESLSYEYELEVQRGLRWFDARIQRVDTEPPSALWLAFDITERREAQRLLQESKARTRAVLESTHDLIVAYDQNYRVLMLNEAGAAAYRKSFGVEIDVGTDVSPLFEGPLADYWRSVTERALAGETFNERIAPNASAADEVYESSFAPIRNADGVVTGFVTITRDISERARFEARLQEMEKMNAIGQLAGGVAHDFNNQLMCMMGYASVLEKTVEEPAARHCAEMIKQVGMRSAQLTAQLLAFARRGQYQAVTVDMHELIAEVQELLHRSIDRRIDIVQDLQAQRGLVVGDPAQLQNALINMALNARDAMPNGGTLRLATADIAPDDADPGLSWIRLSVSDDGVGMSPDTARRIFEPFFTTKPVGAGTGMGLASVYGTIQNHGGQIDVETAPGEGSTFHVFLPASNRPLEFDRSSGETLAAPSTSAAILLVEDDAAVADALGLDLEHAGHRVAHFADGADALAHFDTAGADLAILDLMMPGLTGREVCQALHQRDDDLPIILISGYSVESLREDILHHPRVQFMQKPFTSKQLHSAIARAISPLDSDPGSAG